MNRTRWEVSGHDDSPHYIVTSDAEASHALITPPNGCTCSLEIHARDTTGEPYLVVSLSDDEGTCPAHGWRDDSDGQAVAS